jgi:hypothetical protein
VSKQWLHVLWSLVLDLDRASGLNGGFDFFVQTFVGLPSNVLGTLNVGQNILLMTNDGLTLVASVDTSMYW